MNNSQRPYTLVITVLNEPAMLARIVGIISARGYNIVSLAVGQAHSAVYKEESSANGGISRITLKILADDETIESVAAHLRRPIGVLSVEDLTNVSTRVEADLTLVKVMIGHPAAQAIAITLASSFRALPVITERDYLILRFVGRGDSSRALIEAMSRLGDVESVTCGAIAIA